MKPEFNKEAIYDTEIRPLMAKILEVCKVNELPMIASFCYKANEEGIDLCTSIIAGPGDWRPDAFKDCQRHLFEKPDFMAFTKEIAEKE